MKWMGNYERYKETLSMRKRHQCSFNKIPMRMYKICISICAQWIYVLNYTIVCYEMRMSSYSNGNIVIEI